MFHRYISGNSYGYMPCADKTTVLQQFCTTTKSDSGEPSKLRTEDAREEPLNATRCRVVPGEHTAQTCAIAWLRQLAYSLDTRFAPPGTGSSLPGIECSQPEQALKIRQLHY